MRMLPFRSASNQIKVLRALLLRDVIARFGRGNIGFLWVVVEPMILCSGVLILWTAMKSPFEHGVPVAAVVLTGYMPLTVWRHLTGGGLSIMRRHMSLLYHIRLTPLDIWSAKMFSEALSITAAAIIIFLVLYATGLVEPPVVPTSVLVGWLLMIWYSGSTGLILSALSESTEILEKFIGPFQYLTLPLSGCFFLLDWLPSGFRDIIWYFPLPHAYELIRGGYFGDVVTTYGSIPYLVCWCLAQSGIGLWLFEAARSRAQFA